MTNNATKQTKGIHYQLWWTFLHKTGEFDFYLLLLQKIPFLIYTYICKAEQTKVDNSFVKKGSSILQNQ